MQKNFTNWIGSGSSVVFHTAFFILMFTLTFFGVNFNTVLLVLTTVVSLEAIYLSIFIQMTVNQNTESLEDVEEDIEEIAEEVSEIGDDIDEIQDDVEEIQEDVDESEEDDVKLENIENTLKQLLVEVESLKKR